MDFKKAYEEVELLAITVFNTIKTRGGKWLITFLNLKDTPNSYTGKAGNFLRVKETEDEVEFETASEAASDIQHNELAGKQGGETGEYYHLTAEAYAGSLGWYEISGPTAGAIMKGYIANNVSQVIVTLPATAALGSIIAITGKGAGGWRIAQNAGQVIHMGPFSTVTGTGGYVESIHYLSGVTLLCITANTDWKVVWSVGDISMNVS